MQKNKLILKDGTQFDEAIKLLDLNGNGVLPVVDSANHFIGLITDGDIRKAILNKQLDLEHIINKNPYKYNVDSTNIERLQFLKSIKRRQLPLIDENGFYVDLFVMDDLDFNFKPNSVVIMAGGLGSRLGELTKETPKPMLHVGKKPMLETIIENFIEYGFHKFYISVNYKAEKIIEYFGDGKKWGIEIKYLHETKRLGTAGSLSLIKDTLTEPFLVANGDVITTLNFDELLQYHILKKSTGTMSTREYDYTIPFGVVELKNGKISKLQEKPTYQFKVNAGVYVLDPIVMKYIPEDTFFDMPSLFEDLISQKLDTYTYNIEDYWIDVGHAEAFKKVNNDIQVY